MKSPSHDISPGVFIMKSDVKFHIVFSVFIVANKHSKRLFVSSWKQFCVYINAFEVIVESEC